MGGEEKGIERKEEEKHKKDKQYLEFESPGALSVARLELCRFCESWPSVNAQVAEIKLPS